MEHGAPGTNRHQTFGGMLPPATVSAVYTFETNGYPYLSMAAMLRVFAAGWWPHGPGCPAGG